MRAFGGGIIADPFRVVEWPDGNQPGGHRTLTGKTLRANPRLVAGERTAVLIVAGQSNGSNYVNEPYTPANPAKLDNLNIYDGGVYAAEDPLLGCEKYDAFTTPGNMFLRVADKLITDDLWDRVILVPVAIGGSNVALWNSRPFGDRLAVGFRRAQAQGLDVTAVCWQQGEGDMALGTSQAAYLASLQAVIARPRAEGFAAPWVVAQCSYFLGTTSAAVRAAQVEVVNGTDILAGPDTDTITSGGRYDNGHFSASGANTAAALWVTSLAPLAP